MRKFFTLFCCLFSLLASTQGTLEFNQVKLITGNETVPTGKVWKVTSFIPTDVYRSDYSPAPRTYVLGINGTNRNIGHSGIGDANSRYSSVMTFIPLPLWLPEGTSINPSVSGSYLYGVNVIEFNVVP